MAEQEETRKYQPFLKRVSEDARCALLAMGTVQEFEPRQPLMRMGELGEFVMLIRRGYVKVSVIDQDGSTTIVDVGTTGDLHVEVAVISAGRRMADVVAIGDVQVRRISANEFHQFIADHPTAQKELLVSVCRQFTIAQHQRSKSRTSDALARVTSRLTYLVEICGVPTPEGWKIAVPLSQEELAMFTPMSRTVLAQNLDILRRRGVITTGRKALTVIDRERLATFHQL